MVLTASTEIHKRNSRLSSIRDTPKNYQHRREKITDTLPDLGIDMPDSAAD
jgi:hypothetical protein